MRSDERIEIVVKKKNLPEATMAKTTKAHKYIAVTVSLSLVVNTGVCSCDLPTPDLESQTTNYTFYYTRNYSTRRSVVYPSPAVFRTSNTHIPTSPTSRTIYFWSFIIKYLFNVTVFDTKSTEGYATIRFMSVLTWIILIFCLESGSRFNKYHKYLQFYLMMCNELATINIM